MTTNKLQCFPQFYLACANGCFLLQKRSGPASSPFKWVGYCLSCKAPNSQTQISRLSGYSSSLRLGLCWFPGTTGLNLPLEVRRARSPTPQLYEITDAGLHAYNFKTEFCLVRLDAILHSLNRISHSLDAIFAWFA